MEVGVEITSKLSKAVALLVPFSKRSSTNLLGEILTKMGQSYFDLLQDFESAKENFLKAKNLGDRLTPTPLWLPKVIAGLQKIAVLEGRAKPTEESLDNIFSKIKLQFDHGQEHFYNFILKNHPPIHSAVFKLQDWKSPVVKVDKKLLVSLCYEPFCHPLWGKLS
jgi:hypothetical protein